MARGTGMIVSSRRDSGRAFMGYIEQSLGQNEVVHYRAHFPWLYHAAGWVTLFLGIAATAFLHSFEWLSLIAALAAVALFLAIMVPIWTTEIGVTNQRLIYKRGLLRRATSELQTRSIEEVNLRQGFLGRLLDFGHLVVHGTGLDDIVLPTLADPIGLRKALQDAIAASQPAASIPHVGRR